MKKNYDNHTIIEIKQQINLWKKINDNYENVTKPINDALQHTLDQQTEASLPFRIMLVGAGSSKFIGKYVASYLPKYYQIHAYGTTDVLTNPLRYFCKDRQTILLSIARSGNSPESNQTIHLAQKYCGEEHLYLITITCNKYGRLVKNTKALLHNRTIILPHETNDKGFAMTSSFTSMILVLLMIANPHETNKFVNHIYNVWNKKTALINKKIEQLEKVVQQHKCNRIIFLGSNEFQNLAEEGALKCLELADGKINSYFNTFLGVRHGPKTIINDDTVIIAMLSDNDLTRKYELDFLKEINSQKKLANPCVITLDSRNDDAFKKISEYYLDLSCLDLSKKHNNVFIGLVYMFFIQMFAVKLAVKLGNNIDDPSPSGFVNRVVKGVTCYDK